MQLDIEGRIVLVTGGSKGIGFACAEQFLAEKARVVICSRSRENVDAALVQLPGAQGFAADLSNEDEARDLIDKIETEIGPVDILVNSAGAARRTAVDDLTPAAWRAAMDAKYFSYINVIDPLVKRMGARGAGVIVNMIGGGKTASPTHLAGGAANAALMLATVGLANAYAGRGVRVIGINPGTTRTGRVEQALKAEARQSGISLEQAEVQARKRIPMGRMAEPEEIAQVAVFLASSKASYITGVIIGMDGAQTATIV